MAVRDTRADSAMPVVGFVHSGSPETRAALLPSVGASTKLATLRASPSVPYILIATL
jgi:hypothetical protein